MSRLIRQVSQNYKSGAVTMEQVPIPALRRDGVLVRTRYSVISAGTEGMKVREGKLSYLGKARARPDQLKKVLNSVSQQGLRATYEKVMNRLDSLTPLGYSISGEVVAVGQGAEEFRVGQLVACAGAGYANHAEVNFVPKNLVVPVPEGVALEQAAFATVGAIALQGFRQAEMQLGETACVIGLGLLGQLLVQILRAGGVHVLGVDLVPERCQLAGQLGAKAALTPGDPALAHAVDRWTGGYGVDTVFITAGGSSNAAAELAIELARDRARIVDVGKTRLDLPWNACYAKELDLRFSRSYGPGRYDPSYEERGQDYPIGYVRWTERRNLAAFLDLVAEDRVRLAPLAVRVRPFSEAEAVYEDMARGADHALATVFEYSPDAAPLPAQRPEAVRRTAAAGRSPVRLGVIGAGNYASSMLLPQLARDRSVELVAVATTSGLTGENARRKFGFRHATSDYRELIESDELDAVLIATRHATHARLVAESLRSGKATYVEKPLALGFDELESVAQAVRESGNDRLMVGFNRRFAPLVQQIDRFLATDGGPRALHARIHAGRLETGSWYLDPAEGSRFAGEGGHFIDLLSHFAGARPVSVAAHSLRPFAPTRDDLDNLAVLLRYDNGAVATLQYLTQGDACVPKEHFELFGGGRTAQLHNFEGASLFANGKQRRARASGIDKGQKNALAAFVEAVRTGGPMPIELSDLMDTTFATLAAVAASASGETFLLTESRADIGMPGTTCA